MAVTLASGLGPRVGRRESGQRDDWEAPGAGLRSECSCHQVCASDADQGSAAMPPNSAARACTLCGRSAGSLARQRSNSDSSSGETACPAAGRRRFRHDVHVLVQDLGDAARRRRAAGPSGGSSRRPRPRRGRSAHRPRRDAGSPRAPCRAACRRSSRPASAPATRPTSTALTSPKSTSLAKSNSPPRRVRMMFDGLMSRWISPIP